MDRRFAGPAARPVACEQDDPAQPFAEQEKSDGGYSGILSTGAETKKAPAMRRLSFSWWIQGDSNP